MTSHDQILDKHTIVDMFLMTSHDQILDKHTIVDMFLMTSHQVRPFNKGRYQVLLPV
jgi:hypothetical protein